MTPPFKNKQEIICIVDGQWMYKNVFIKKLFGVFGKRNKPSNGPKKDEHCWVTNSAYSEGEWFIDLFGYEGRCYSSKWFRAAEPKQNSITLEEKTKEILKETTPLIHKN